MVNPFLSPLQIAGTDGMQSKPMSTPEDKQYIFVDTLYRVGELEYKRKEEQFGFDLLRY